MAGIHKNIAGQFFIDPVYQRALETLVFLFSSIEMLTVALIEAFSGHWAYWCSGRGHIFCINGEYMDFHVQRM